MKVRREGYDANFFKLSSKLKKVSDIDLISLLKNNKNLYKATLGICIDNPQHIQLFAKRLEKIDLVLRNILINIIESEIFSFDDDLIMRDNKIIKIAVDEEMLRRIYKNNNL